MAPVANLTLAEAAARYAAAGWPVFPLHHVPVAGGCSCPEGTACRQPGKHPRRAGGHHHATTNPAQVAAWWRRWPTANIGIPTGPASGLAVVDLDGPAGAATWTHLTRRHGAAPATATATTPHGRHHWYRHPDNGPAIPRRIGLLGPGVDLLGDRGYAIAPPSAIPCTRQTPHDGPCSGRYTWTTPRARLAPLPGWITAATTLIRREPGQVGEPGQVQVPLPATPRPVRRAMRAARTDRLAHAPAAPSAYARVALVGEAARVAAAPKGQHNDTLNTAAYRLGRLVGAGLLDPQKAHEALFEAAVDCGHVADDGEHVARRTIESGLNAGAANPRTPARPAWRRHPTLDV